MSFFNACSLHPALCVPRLLAFLAALALCPTFSAFPAEEAPKAKSPVTVRVGDRNLQDVIDEVPPYSEVICNANREITVSTTTIIRKPLTLKGLHARLAEGVGDTPIISVESDRVAIEDFDLCGNTASITQENEAWHQQRASLIVVKGDRFRVENGLVSEASRHGVMVSAFEKGADLSHGVVRNIVGRGNRRDTVSLEGGGRKGHYNRNILVENIRAYDSPARGAVEVCDGNRNVTVRDVYAESCVYGVDVQDHGYKGENNQNIMIEGVYVTDCPMAMRTANSPKGHRNLTVRDVTGENWPGHDAGGRLRITNTDNVFVENCHISDNSHGEDVFIGNCLGVNLRSVSITNPAHRSAGVQIRNCGNVLVDGLTFLGARAKPKCALLYSITRGEVFRNLQIRNVCVPDLSTGILLESQSENGALENYEIENNLARTVDKIKGAGASIGAQKAAKPVLYLPLDDKGDARAVENATGNDDFGWSYRLPKPAEAYSTEGVVDGAFDFVDQDRGFGLPKTILNDTLGKGRDFTIAFWWKTAKKAIRKTEYVLRKWSGDYSDPGLTAFLYPDRNRLVMRVVLSKDLNVSASFDNVNDGKWHRYVFLRRDDSLKLIRDKEVAAGYTGKTVTEALGENQSLAIGPANGAMDDLRIYDVALSKSEIHRLGASAGD